MKEFFNALGKSKIPSLLLLAMLYLFGSHLIKGETWDSISAISGAIILIISATLTVFSYADFRKREEFESIIKNYDKALTSISNTHTKYEKLQQKTLTNENQKSIGEETQKKYNVQGEQTTLDE